MPRRLKTRIVGLFPGACMPAISPSSLFAQVLETQAYVLGGAGWLA